MLTKSEENFPLSQSQFDFGPPFMPLTLFARDRLLSGTTQAFFTRSSCADNGRPFNCVESVSWSLFVVRYSISDAIRRYLSLFLFLPRVLRPDPLRMFIGPRWFPRRCPFVRPPLRGPRLNSAVPELEGPRPGPFFFLRFFPFENVQMAVPKDILLGERTPPTS